MTDVSAAPASTPPVGWYPDPGGAAQWRRWLGTSWGDATMPYAPPPPNGVALLRERLAWNSLRPIARLAIAAPAFAAVSLAGESSEFAAVRTWAHRYMNAVLHGRAAPALPTSALPQNSALQSTVTLVVSVLALLGLVAWVRFSASSIRVASSAGYPQRHGPYAAGALLVVPFVGPFVASSASRASLPTGHEARSVLSRGWLLVVAGEIAYLALNATELWTSSRAVTWLVAAACALAWCAAAYELPLGLTAIAEDHDTLDGTRTRTS